MVRAIRPSRVLFAVLVLLGISGCGVDDVLLVAHDHAGPPHTLMRVGSTVSGGGKLGVLEAPVAYVVESACLGGVGDGCTGGTVVYSGESPGFNDLAADDPTRPLFVLPEGVDVFVEVTAVEPGASLLISGQVLDQVGERALVNASGHLHNHPEWQLAAPAGVNPQDRRLRLRLHADGFASSDEIEILLRMYEDADHAAEG